MRHAGILRKLTACMLLSILPHGARAQVPDGSSLDLSGFTPPLELDTSHGFGLLSGELPWWSTYQLPPKPFTLSSFPVALGLPPNAAWPAVSAGGLKQQMPDYTHPYYSGYYNEAEVYPNADENTNIAFGTVLQAPSATAGGLMSLIAQPIAQLEVARLPSQLNGRNYISGALNTYPYSQTYGYFELDGQIPPGKGLWPAFWMVPENMNTSGDIEIDVMEIVAGQTNILNSTLHTTDRNSPAFPKLGKAFHIPVDLSQGYHRYGVDWEPEWITFYLDGTSFFSMKTPADMRQPMYIIANLAVGTPTSWGGAPDTSTHFPAAFNIASIRAWSRPK